MTYYPLNRFNDEGARILSGGIAVNTSIIFLDLSNCNISDAAGEVLAKSFLVNGVCQELNLSWNSLGLQTAKVFQDVLVQNVALVKLDLSHNAFFEDYAIVNIMKGLEMNESLEYLDISWNALCGEPFGKIISKSLKTSKLNVLKLENNRMSKFELKKLSLGLKNSETIKEVYIKGNLFGDEDDVRLINVFKSKSPLELLSFGEWFHISQEAFNVSCNISYCCS